MNIKSSDNNSYGKVSLSQVLQTISIQIIVWERQDEYCKIILKWLTCQVKWKRLFVCEYFYCVVLLLENQRTTHLIPIRRNEKYMLSFLKRILYKSSNAIKYISLVTN